MGVAVVSAKTFVVVASVVVFAAGAVTVPASAVTVTAKKYANCASLLKDYPDGVAKSKKARNAAVRDGFDRPKVNKTLYVTNGARLDRDKDGVMCEQGG